MSRFVRKAWSSFGSLLDWSPRRGAGRQLARTRMELSTRRDRDMLTLDFYRIGKDIKTTLGKQHG